MQKQLILELAIKKINHSLTGKCMNVIVYYFITVLYFIVTFAGLKIHLVKLLSFSYLNNLHMPCIY